MEQRIYLCREHVQVGEERIHMATTAKHTAENWAWQNNTRTKTKNFDVVECINGKLREDS